MHCKNLKKKDMSVKFLEQKAEETFRGNENVVYHILDKSSMLIGIVVFADINFYKVGVGKYMTNKIEEKFDDVSEVKFVGLY